MQDLGYGLPRTPQPVEKVVVAPVGSSREPENKPKHYENDVFGLRTGGTREREGVFQHAGPFHDVG
jgi:hypothetical protein